MEYTGTTEATGALPVTLTINIDSLILAVFPLGRRVGKTTYPATHTVELSRLAVVSAQGEASDRDRIPEVYRPGERIVRQRFQNRTCTVIEFGQRPGDVYLRVGQVLPGISLSTSDPAVAIFRFPLVLENPLQLLAHEPRWKEPDGKDRLKNAVTAMIEQNLTSVLYGVKIQLWSNPDVRTVAEMFHRPLNDHLSSWGLRAECLPASRRFPARLYQVALQLRAAERCLLDADTVEQGRMLAALGFPREDLGRIRNISNANAPGAGLFLVARDRWPQRAEAAQPINAWLEEHGALDAAILLRAFGSRPQEMELSAKVVEDALRYPMLGIGEYVDSDHRLVQATAYRQMQAYMQQ